MFIVLTRLVWKGSFAVSSSPQFGETSDIQTQCETWFVGLKVQVFVWSFAGLKKNLLVKDTLSF